MKFKKNRDCDKMEHANHSKLMELCKQQSKKNNNFNKIQLKLIKKMSNSNSEMLQ